MSKPRSQKSQKPARDVSQHWAARGYLAELATSAPASNEDPRGETAYQRAFHSAAELSPPMLPNPSHYPNSPSARDYLMRKSMDLEALQTEKRSSNIENYKMQPPAQRLRNPDRSPVLLNNNSSSASPGSAYSQNAKFPSPTQYAPYTDNLKANSASFYKQPPVFLEPSGAPLGPMNKLK